MALIGMHLAWNCMVLILLCSINSSFAAPTQHVLVKRELALGKLNMKMKDAYGSVLNFFRPVTCLHKNGQILIPCDIGEGLNATECMEHKCCPSKTRYELQCYVPFEDNHGSLQNMQLIFRVLLLVAAGFLILGCLPLCCCACLQRSSCVDPLRKANRKLKQTAQKKKTHNEDSYVPLLDGIEKNS